MLDLKLCEFKFPISPVVARSIKDAADSVNEYPEYDELYERMEKYTGYSRKYIFLGDGSNEVITLLSQDMLEKGDRVVVIKPDFPMYKMQADRMGAEVETVDCFDKGFEINPEEVIEAAQGAKIVWMSNPNNPTGGVTPKRVIKEIVENVDSVVCVDECYFNYYGKTVMPWVRKYENLMVLRSFSKTHGLAGLRFGYAVAQPELISRTKSYFKFEVNRLAVVAAMAAMRDDESYYEEVWKKIAEERKFVAEGIRSMGLEVLPSNTTFLCFRIGDGEAAKRWLKANDVHLKVAYGMPEWLRVGIGTREMNKEFLGILERFLNEKGGMKVEAR